jgi:glycogen synthase
MSRLPSATREYPSPCRPASFPGTDVRCTSSIVRRCSTARQFYTFDPDEHRRFLLFTRAALESCRRLGFAPDIFHCNDWHTAFLPLYLKTLYASDPLFARALGADDS